MLITLWTSCQSDPDLDGYLQDLHTAGLLNGNVLIVRDDSVVLRRSLGWADPTARRPLTPEHRFAIGSIQKEFPAVAVMRLVEDGVVYLDDPVVDYMRGLPEWSERVTIRHLLTYSSGLPEVDWEDWFADGRVPRQEDILDSLHSRPAPGFPPGTDYHYTHYSPFLLQRIVEEVTAMDFAAFVQEELCYPYGLEGIAVKDRYPYFDTAGMALPFGEEGTLDDLSYELTTVCTTTDGLYGWVQAVDNFELLTEISVRNLSQEARHGEEVQSALGRADWSGEQMTFHQHHGSSHNYEALVRYYKREGLTIVLLTNRKQGNLHEIADTLRAIVLTEQV